MPIDTSKIIMDAFEELMAENPRERITIKELVEHCGITRKTFYYHFDDIYDLMDQVAERSLNQLYRESLKTGSVEEFLRLFASFIFQKKGMFQRITETEKWEQVKGRMFHRIQEFFFKMAEDHLGIIGCTKLEIDVSMNFFIYGIIGTLTQQEYRTEEEQEQVIRQLCRLIKWKMEGASELLKEPLR